MGSPIHKCQRTELLNQPPTFLKYARTESIYRQALSLQNIDVAEKTDRELPRRQPIWPLAKITKQSYVHLAKKTLDKRRPKFRMVIEEPCVAGAWPGFADIAHLDLTFPFRIQQIPIRFKLLCVDDFRVVINGTVGRRTDIVEDVLVFRIGVLVFFQIPPGLIGDLGLDQSRFDRVERFGLIELLIVWIRPRAHHIGQILLRTPLGKESLAKLIATHRNSHDLDIRKLFLEMRQHGLVTTDVNDNLTFPFGRLDSLFPLLLPSRIRLSGVGQRYRVEKMNR